jgi:hypothetical protein
MVAHYARAGEASSGVIRIDPSRRRAGSSAATTVHPTNGRIAQPTNLRARPGVIPADKQPLPEKVDVMFGINPVVPVAIMAALTAVAGPASAQGGDRVHATPAVVGPVSLQVGDWVRTTTLKFDTDVVDYVRSVPPRVTQ